MRRTLIIKYYYKVGTGFAGCDDEGILEAKNEEEAMELARQYSIDNAEMYGMYQDPDAFGDLDTIGTPICEDEYTEEELEDLEVEGYEDATGELDYYVEVYNEEEHGWLTE